MKAKKIEKMFGAAKDVTPISTSLRRAVLGMSRDV